MANDFPVNAIRSEFGQRKSRKRFGVDLQILGVVDWDTGEELERACDNEEVIIDGDNAGIGVEARNDWVDEACDNTGKH